MSRPDEDKLNQLITVVGELRTQLNELQTNFQVHDHGATYNPNNVAINTEASSLTYGTFSSTPNSSVIPTGMFEPG